MNETVINGCKVLIKEIAHIMKRYGVTQQDLADRTGYNRTSISKMLNPKIYPSHTTHSKLIAIRKTAGEILQEKYRQGDLAEEDIDQWDLAAMNTIITHLRNVWDKKFIKSGEPIIDGNLDPIVISMLYHGLSSALLNAYRMQMVINEAKKG